MENRQLLDLQKLELDSSRNINVNSEDSSCTYLFVLSFFL